MNTVKVGEKVYTHVVATDIRILFAKFHCYTLISMEDSEDCILDYS